MRYRYIFSMFAAGQEDSPDFCSKKQEDSPDFSIRCDTSTDVYKKREFLLIFLERAGSADFSKRLGEPPEFCKGRGIQQRAGGILKRHENSPEFLQKRENPPDFQEKPDNSSDSGNKDFRFGKGGRILQGGSSGFSETEEFLRFFAKAGEFSRNPPGSFLGVT